MSGLEAAEHSRPDASPRKEKAMFFDDTVANIYVIALLVGGVILLATAGVGFGSGVGARVINGILGLGMLGYAVYLLFFFEGGTIEIFFYVFIVPFLAIINLFKNRKAKDEAQPPAAGPSLPVQ
jgi:hypothetical protein